jgi:hypothetical protein
MLARLSKRFRRQPTPQYGQHAVRTWEHATSTMNALPTESTSGMVTLNSARTSFLPKQNEADM